MVSGISSAEVGLIKNFLLQRDLLDDDPKYDEGYRQAVKDMAGMLEEKVRQNLYDSWGSLVEELVGDK